MQNTSGPEMTMEQRRKLWYGCYLENWISWDDFIRGLEFMGGNSGEWVRYQ